MRQRFDREREILARFAHPYIARHVIGAARAARVPSVRTVHGAAEHAYGVWNVRQRLIAIGDSVVGRHLQRAIVCVSDTLAAAERTKLATHVHMIPNGVDIENVCALGPGFDSKSCVPLPAHGRGLNPHEADEAEAPNRTHQHL